MASGDTNTPSHDGGCAASDTASPALEWAADLRKSTAEDYAAGRIDRATLYALIASAEFAERTHSIGTTGSEVNLWGFGDVPVLFEPEDGRGFWTALHYLIEPAGCDMATLTAEFDSDTEDEWPGVDQLVWRDNDDIERTLPIVNYQFCMRILAGVSPWAKEFNKNMQGTFRRAFVCSGLADTVGIAVVQLEDGTTKTMPMTDVLGGGEPLPTETEATERAFRGPAGAL